MIETNSILMGAGFVHPFKTNVAGRPGLPGKVASAGADSATQTAAVAANGSTAATALVRALMGRLFC